MKLGMSWYKYLRYQTTITSHPASSLPCDWEATGEGQRLVPKISQIQSQTGVTLDICKERCVNESSAPCVAVNYKTTDRKCELLLEREYTATVEDTAGWKYYLRPACAGNFSSLHLVVTKLAGHFCLSSSLSSSLLAQYSLPQAFLPVSLLPTSPLPQYLHPTSYLFHSCSPLSTSSVHASKWRIQLLGTFSTDLERHSITSYRFLDSMEDCWRCLHRRQHYIAGNCNRRSQGMHREMFGQTLMQVIWYTKEWQYLLT